MIDYIIGEVSSITPTHTVLERSGIGYYINISLFTREIINQSTQVKLYIHEIIKEDAHELFGFYTEEERTIFKLLISVSGVGANTARLLLSSMSPQEIKLVIAQGQTKVLQGVKGIGLKTAERIIIDLRDKMNNDTINSVHYKSQHNKSHEEALSALLMLGFPKPAIEKILQKLILEKSNITPEDLVKLALKHF